MIKNLITLVGIASISACAAMKHEFVQYQNFTHPEQFKYNITSSTPEPGRPIQMEEGKDLFSMSYDILELEKTYTFEQPVDIYGDGSFMGRIKPGKYEPYAFIKFRNQMYESICYRHCDYDIKNRRSPRDSSEVLLISEDGTLLPIALYWNKKAYRFATPGDDQIELKGSELKAEVASEYIPRKRVTDTYTIKDISEYGSYKILGPEHREKRTETTLRAGHVVMYSEDRYLRVIDPNFDNLKYQVFTSLDAAASAEGPDITTLVPTGEVGINTHASSQRAKLKNK